MKYFLYVFKALTQRKRRYRLGRHFYFLFIGMQLYFIYKANADSKISICSENI